MPLLTAASAFRLKVKIKEAYLCSAYYELLISRCLGVAHVNEHPQFYLPPTRLFTSRMSHTCL